MSVWGVAMVKDEADVIERNLRHHHAEGLAGMIVLDNRSADGTAKILFGLAAGDLEGWLRVVDDPEPGYYQSSKMTSAARMARTLGATWVVPIDADELWYSPDGRPLAEAILLDQRPDVTIRCAALFDHRATALDHLTYPDVDDPFTRMTWRHPDPIPLPKVAVRTDVLRKIEMGNHGAHVSQGRALGGLEVRHFPYRSAEHMIRKARNGAAAYAAAPQMPEMYGAHWRAYGKLTDEELAAHYHDHFWFADPTGAGLVNDPAPVRP
jgi:hypothetical protein